MGKYSAWELPDQAAIFSLEETAKYVEDVRRSLGSPRFILTSGGFDPLHAGHITCIQDSKTKCAETRPPSDQVATRFGKLIVIVNSDEFLKIKKGKAFMPQMVRCQVVSALSGVDIVVPFNPTNPSDMSVCEALGVIKPDYFTKGGDRDISNIPEVEVCSSNGIEVVQGCGDEKTWSSSGFLEDYQAWVRKIYAI